MCQRFNLFNFSEFNYDADQLKFSFIYETDMSKVVVDTLGIQLFSATHASPIYFAHGTAAGTRTYAVNMTGTRKVLLIKCVDVSLHLFYCKI